MAVFLKLQDRSEVFLPQQLGPGSCFGNHRRQSSSLRANPSCPPLLGSRQETASLPSVLSQAAVP